MTVIRQDRRSLTPVVCAVVSHVQKAMPQHPFALLAFRRGVVDYPIKGGASEGGEIISHHALFLGPAPLQVVEVGKVMGPLHRFNLACWYQG